MSKFTISGNEFASMLMTAGQLFQTKVDQVNDLNVFPVPDGDTGTNMYKTLTTGIEQLQGKSNDHIGKCADAFSKGLLLGARGNSGVILSQLFRGFSKYLATFEEANTIQLANALQQGVDTAFKAVVKPVEGTILTVAREVAKHAQIVARQTTDHVELLTEIVNKATEALNQTPDQLPVLKQAGVVDAGGQGLVYIYTGLLNGLKGEWVANDNLDAKRSNPKLSYAPIEIGKIVESIPAQTKISPDKIEFIYDLEFIVQLSGLTDVDWAIQTKALQSDLEKVGDSIVVVAEDQIVKVHVHAKSPGDILNIAIQYGELSGFHLENMKDRHLQIISQSHPELKEETLAPTKPFGLVVVASGEGLQEIFNSLNVDIVLDGGETMNPSSEDLLTAIISTRAEHVFVLPNNPNIILAANQAAELTQRKVTVIPTKSIQQGFEAALAFDGSQTAAEIEEKMLYAVSQVQSGQIAMAVRKSQVDGIHVDANDYVGMLEGEIVYSSIKLIDAAQQLLNKMIVNGDEVVSIITGEDAIQADTDQIIAYIQSKYPNVEVEELPGDQPIYIYLFAVEK